MCVVLGGEGKGGRPKINSQRPKKKAPFPDPTTHHPPTIPPHPTNSLQTSSGYEIFTRAKYFGGDFDDFGAEVITDPSDPTAVYGVGLSLSPVFVVGMGPLELVEKTTPPHAWLVRMDGPSSRILWTRSLGSVAGVTGSTPRLAIDGASKALYVSGATFLSLPPTTGGGSGTASTVLRVNTANGDIVWARNVPQAWGVTVQRATGQPFVAGYVCICVRYAL